MTHIFDYREDFLDALHTRCSQKLRGGMPSGKPWRPTLVSIDGRSGSGKSTLAAELHSRLNTVGVNTVLFQMENLYQGWEGLGAAIEQWQSISVSVNSGRKIDYVSWDWDFNQPTEPFPFIYDDAEVFLCEGVGASQGMVDVRCWVELDPETRKQRALARDGDTFAPYWDTWAHQEEQMLQNLGFPAPFDYALRVHPGQ